jgi:hypothetical protein
MANVLDSTSMKGAVFENSRFRGLRATVFGGLRNVLDSSEEKHFINNTLLND